MNNNTISGILSVIGGKVGVIFLSVLITPLLVRILGSSNYGDYAFVLSIFSIITIFAHAGISAGIRKYIVETREETKWKEHVFVFYARLAIALAVMFAFLLVIFGLYGPIDLFLGDRFSLYFILLSAMLISNQLFYISRFTLMGLHLERYSEPLPVLQKLLLGLFGLSLAYIGFDVAGVLAGTSIAYILCAIIATWILRHHIDIGAVFYPLPDSFPKWELFSFNFYNTIFILLSVSLYNIDILLLHIFIGSQQTGFYKAALVIAEFLWLVPTAVQIVFIHSSSKLWSEGKYDMITEMASQASRYTLIFTTLLLLGVASLATPFVEIYYGSEFGSAVTPLLLLLPGVLGFAVARPIYAIGQGRGKLRILIVATGLAAIINLVLNLILIPRYGMSGAAISTSIGYGSMLIFHYFAARQIGFNPFKDLRLSRFILTTAVAAPVIFGTSSAIESRIISLIIVPPIGILIYSTVALRSGAISAKEVIPLLERTPEPISGWSIKTVRYVD